MSEDPKPLPAGSPVAGSAVAGSAVTGSALAASALAELEGALREAAVLLRSLKSDNERLTRQNTELRTRSERLVAAVEEGGAGRSASLDLDHLTALAPASELAGRIIELEEQRRSWLRDRRRMADRVEGILDKLEYLQSESNSN